MASWTDSQKEDMKEAARLLRKAADQLEKHEVDKAARSLNDSKIIFDPNGWNWGG